MKTFLVSTEEAMQLHRQIFGVEDSNWSMLVEGEKHEVSDGYDLNSKHKRLNLYNRLRVLDGTDHKTVLGADTPLDKVQITRKSPDTCGCTYTMLWHNDDSNTRYPHRGEVHCEHHVHLKDDHAAHYHEAEAVNDHKNLAVGMLADHLDVSPNDILWTHSLFVGDRTLILTHPKLADPFLRGSLRHTMQEKLTRPLRLSHETAPMG